MIDEIESVGRAYGEQAGSSILARLNVNGGTYNGFLDTKEPLQGVEKLVDLTCTCVSDRKAFLSNTSQDWPMWSLKWMPYFRRSSILKTLDVVVQQGNS